MPTAPTLVTVTRPELTFTAGTAWTNTTHGTPFTDMRAMAWHVRLYGLDARRALMSLFTLREVLATREAQVILRADGINVDSESSAEQLEAAFAAIDARGLGIRLELNDTLPEHIVLLCSEGADEPFAVMHGY